jgi:hypothetical protein
MRAKLLLAALAALLTVSLSQTGSAGGWDESGGVIQVPTTVYHPVPLRHKHCMRHVRRGCWRGPQVAHAYVAYRYNPGWGYHHPRHHYRWRGYGWNW